MNSWPPGRWTCPRPGGSRSAGSVTLPRDCFRTATCAPSSNSQRRANRAAMHRRKIFGDCWDVNPVPKRVRSTRQRAEKVTELPPPFPLRRALPRPQARKRDLRARVLPPEFPFPAAQKTRGFLRPSPPAGHSRPQPLVVRPRATTTGRHCDLTVQVSPFSGGWRRGVRLEGRVVVRLSLNVTSD